MVLVVATGRSFVDQNNRWENYTALKQHYRYSNIEEIKYSGSQLSTVAAAAFDHTDATIAFLGANDIVYIKSEADLAGLDGDSIWMDYLSSTGTLYRNVESKFDSATSTASEVPIGSESGTYIDAVAAVAGSNLTMTGLNRSVANDLAGWYVVASGDATDMEGNYLTIASNTAASPTVITCTTAPNANWAADNVSVQQTLNNDVFRIRRIWAETESPTDNSQYICDFNGGNLYAVIQDGQTTGGAGSRYFTPSTATCKSYLGYVKCKAGWMMEADATVGGFQVAITYTPKAVGSSPAADITHIFKFNEDFDWQPCIELAPATDVIITILKTVDADHTLVHLDSCMLEIYGPQLTVTT